MITSASNPRLKLVRRLQGRSARARLGLFVCEGEDLVAAGLDAGMEPVEALVDAERPALLERLAAAEPVAGRLMSELSTLGHPARVIGVFRHADLPRLGSGLALRHSAPDASMQDLTPGLALWHVGDPGNVGTLLRTADALGPAFMALSGGCADPTGPKALRASAGAIFRVPTCTFDDAPGPRVALVAGAPTTLAELGVGERFTFVLGAERAGLPDEVVDGCDAVASIPQAPGAESLNVAVAGAIALYELRRRALT